MFQNQLALQNVKKCFLHFFRTPDHRVRSPNKEKYNLLLIKALRYFKINKSAIK